MRARSLLTESFAGLGRLGRERGAGADHLRRPGGFGAGLAGAEGADKGQPADRSVHPGGGHLHRRQGQLQRPGGAGQDADLRAHRRGGPRAQLDLRGPSRIQLFESGCC